MLSKRIARSIALLLALAFLGSLPLRAQVWDFLGDTRIDGTRDHDNIQVTRHGGSFRAIHLRVSDEAIFFERVVVHFGDGTSEKFPVADRISPEGRNYVIELPGQRRVLESIELWYFKGPWERNPRVSLYGTGD